MADQKQVLDMQVSKGITAAQSNEHLRDRSERAEKYAMNKGNYDPTRKHLNFEIAPGGKVRPMTRAATFPNGWQTYWRGVESKTPTKDWQNRSTARW